MDQALHIFKKDVELLRYHIGGTLLCATVFCLMGTFNRDGAGVTAFILPVTWWFLIGAVVQAEPLPGRAHFWLVRPYRRGSLLLAKALFVMTFANIPLLIADVVIVQAAGFPITQHVGGFLWTQVLLVAAFEIPAAAIASITSNVLELIIAASFLLLGGFVGLLTVPMSHLGILWSSLEWVKNYCLLGEVAIGAGVLLICQYAYRATGMARMAAIGGPILLLAIAALLPWTTAFRVQSHFSKRMVDASSVRIRMDAEHKWAGHSYFNDRDEAVAEVPIRVDGLPAGVVFRPLGVATSLIEPNGQILEMEGPPCDVFVNESGILALRLTIPKSIYAKFRTEPVRVNGAFYFSLFHTLKPVTLPLDGSRSYVSGVGLCTASSDRLACHSPFHWPETAVEFSLTEQSERGQASSTEELSGLNSSSPFPADFNINPLVRFAPRRLAAISDVVVKPTEPVAYGEKHFEIADVVLAEFTFHK